MAGMRAFVAGGSNLGDRLAHLRQGLARLAESGVGLSAISSVWETDAIDCADPLPFLNLVVETRFDGTPRQLLDRMLAVERRLGRRRGVRRNEPRALDLDLLWSDTGPRCEPGLVLPHPRMWDRRFVLAPLAELAPDLADASCGLSVADHERRLRTGQPGVVRVGALDGIIGALREPSTA